MGKTLSIETGIRCNNRCRFCYQLGWRDPGARLPEPPFEALKEKLDWGRANGCDEVGFSGGEPTLRQDFMDLVRHARTAGYRRVSLTTNGRRFSNRDYAATLLKAGVDSIGWSLHGPEASLHDDLVGREGAFRQLMQGIENVADLARRRGRRVDQNLFVLVNRLNHERLVEVCRLGIAHGIRLVVFQPIIYSKGNLATAAGFAVPLETLVASVRRAALAGRREGWFVKLFNLPPCFFPDILEAFEHQRYPVEIFRYQEKSRAGESSPPAEQGYVRLDRCAHCLLPAFCPGLHQSLLSQEAVCRLACETLAVPKGAGRPWLAGCELMAPETLTRFLRSARSRAAGGGLAGRTLKLYHGGDSVAGERFVAAAVAGGADEIVLVLRGREEESSDITAMSGGNAAALAAAMHDPLLAGRSGCVVSLAVPFFDSPSRELMERLEPLARAGVTTLEIQLPWDFKRPQVFDAVKLGRVLAGWRRAGGLRLRVVAPDEQREGTALFRWPTGVLADLSLASDSYAEHLFSSRQGGWVALSVPPVALRPEEGAPQGRQVVLPALPGSPIDRPRLARMRQG